MKHKSTRCLFFVALLGMGSCRSLQAQEGYEKNDSTKPLYLNAKTNMLYDALLIPNIGLEVDLGKRWSIAANWMYGWWDNAPRHWYWRAYGGDVAIRKWVGSAAGRKPLTGHHIGVYGQIFKEYTYVVYPTGFNQAGSYNRKYRASQEQQALILGNQL